MFEKLNIMLPAISMRFFILLGYKWLNTLICDCYSWLSLECAFVELIIDYR